MNLLQRYDTANHILMSGDGTWRVVDATKLPSGEFVVPSYDGTVAFVFDSAGHHIRTVDGHLGTELLNVTYDGAGRLSEISGSVNGQPVHVSVQRDSNGASHALVGIDGGSTALAYDSNGHLTAITNPAGETTEIKWNSAGLVESYTDHGGGVEKFTYDSLGNLTSASDADGVMQHYERKASDDSLEIRRLTPSGWTWAYRVEAVRGGIRRSLIAPDGTKAVQTTAQNGRRALELADGTKWAIGFLTNPVWGNAAPMLTPIVQTRSDGVASRRDIKYSLKAQPGIPYEQSGSLLTIINGSTWTQNFDPTRRTVDLVDPTSRTKAWHYDDNGRLLSYSAPGVAPASYSYNAEGRIAIETRGTGKAARTTRYKYDANTGEIVTTREDGVTQKIAVDRAGRTVAVSAGDGSTALGGYDPAGRLNQIQPPGGLKFTIGLSDAGRATAFVPPPVKGDASIEISSYDRDGQLTGVSGLGNRSITYEHDSAGRETSSKFDQGIRNFAYDARSGLVTQESDPSGISAAYGYTASTPTRLAWNGPITGSVSLALDADGRTARESVNGAHDLTFSYDAAGNLTGVGALLLKRDQESGFVTSSTLGIVENKQQFDANGLLARSTTMVRGKSILDLRYTRDALGRIKSLSETRADGKTSTTEYSYDRADRLASVRSNGRTVETDTYDAAGNRVDVATSGGSVKASYDDRDRLLRVGATQYSWMPDGTLAGVEQSGRATALVYDDFGALRQASLPDGRKITYLIDADGRRVGREVDGKLVAAYLYRPDGTIAAETDSAGKVVSRFGFDDVGRLALVERSGVTYRVITDQVGSPRLFIDSRTGSVADQIAYDAWGNATYESAPGFVPIGFSGGLRDPDTGLIRFGARDYDPQTGRWTAADPIRFTGGDANLYLYAANDPVNLTDPTGQFVPGMYWAIPVVVGTGYWYGLGWTVWNTFHQNSSNSNTPPPTGPSSNNGWPGWLPPPPANVEPINYKPAPPPNTGNPPNGNNPTNPPGNNSPGSPPWGCQGIFCGPNGPHTGGCMAGSCNRNQYGFTCNAIFCFPPNGGFCVWCNVSQGEPHATSASGAHFDFQAVGEFLISRSLDGKQLIQVRQEAYYAGAPASINTAVAANVNGDRIGVYVKEPSFLMVNGLAVTGSDVQRRLPRGGKLERHGGEVVIVWPDGSRLSITRVADSLNYAFDPGTHDTEFSGLLGTAHGEKKTIAARDGNTVSISDPDFVNKLYKQVGNSWRIRQAESLFHYWPGESTAKFTDLTFPPKYVSVNSLAVAERSKAESICRAVGIRTEPLLDDCILDVGVTGMPAFAAASVGVRLPKTSGSAVPGSSLSSPTAPTAADHFSINIGDTVSPDQPTSGAGSIKSLGQKQFYSFQGRAGEVIFVGQGPCEGAQPNFDLLTPDNKLLANVIGNCNADIGRQRLPVTGTYTIVTSTDKSNVNSRYSFFVHAVLPDQHFSVRLPLTISPDSPTHGSGRIAAAGAQQFYDFSAPAGATIHIEGKCRTRCPRLSIRATAPGDENARFFDLNYLKNDWKLPSGGKHTIQVRSNGYVGEYSFTASINGHE